MARALASLVVACVAFVAAAPDAHARAPATGHTIEHDLQHWHNAFLFTRVQPPLLQTKSPLVGYLELQPRFSLWQAQGPTVALLRAAVGVELAPGLTVWAGMGSVPSWSDAGWTVNELRLWQQVLYTQRSPDGVQLMWRARLEERSFEQLRDVGLRARVLLRASVDVPGTDRRLAALVWDEPFVGLTPVPGKSVVGFDQNRAFAGGIFRLTPWLGFELGYLNVLLGDPTRDGARMLHVLSASTVLNGL
jgi:hypothetical protein